MTRHIKVAAAQLGPIHRTDGRERVVRRLIALLREAHASGAQLVVFPELALTTFFPRYWYDDIAGIDAWFEREMPNAATRPLFDLATELNVGFYLGYAELAEEGGATHRYNTSILVGPHGGIIGKYRKVHLPGHADHREGIPFQHLEKRYFEVGNLGFPVWRAFGGVVGMMICNDRRWPEAYRVMGLQGAELILLGYNTPTFNIYHPEPWHLRMFHNRLVAAGGRLPERLLGRGNRQGGRGGRPRPDRRLLHRRPDRRDRGSGPLRGRRGDRVRLRPRPLQPLQEHGIRLRRSTAGSSTTA